MKTYYLTMGKVKEIVVLANNLREAVEEANIHNGEYDTLIRWHKGDVSEFREREKELLRSEPPRSKDTGGASDDDDAKR